MKSIKNTVESVAYVAVVVAAFVLVTAKGVQLSATFTRYRTFPGLSSGWIAKQRVDLSDPQWRDFRRNVFLLSVVMFVFVAISKLIRIKSSKYCLVYYLGFSFLFVGYLHGVYFVHLFALVMTNFWISVLSAGKPNGSLYIWISNCLFLAIVKLTDGLPLSSLKWLAFLEKFRGPVRWHIGFNLIILRMISFGLDYHWASCNTHMKKTTLQKSNLSSIQYINFDVKLRSEEHLNLNAYNFCHYLVYIFYPPLYLAGPISTFNNFIHQLQAPHNHSQQQKLMAVLKSAFRSIVMFLTLELMMHYIYINGAVKYEVWNKLGRLKVKTPLSAVDYGVFGFWSLTFIWMKFLVIWSFFRMWSIADDVEPPENMCRCMFNNCDIEGFWKNWHSSFYLWLVRYLYIPLGGTQRQWLSVSVVFAFVAIWHDIEWKLLQWAWIMVVVFFLESAIKKLSKNIFSSSFKESTSYRHLSAGIASVNIFLLMLVNMIGYGPGPNSVFTLFSEVIMNPAFVGGMLLTFYSATQLMFWIRSKEAQLGHRIYSPMICPYRDRTG